jgi:hypothetical protein
LVETQIAKTPNFTLLSATPEETKLCHDKLERNRSKTIRVNKYALKHKIPTPVKTLKLFDDDDDNKSDRLHSSHSVSGDVGRIETHSPV